MKNGMKLTKNFWTSLILSIIFFASIQYACNGVFADPDGFYHAKASQLLQKGELHNTFPWLYYTTWNQGYADQHFLYHWLLVPFNTLEKLQNSITIFAIIFVLLFLLVLEKYKASFSVFWTAILLGGSVDFLFRIGLVKANTLSLALLCGIVILIWFYHNAKSQKNLLWSLFGIAAISGVFVWTYGGFVFVPFLLAAYAAAYIVSDIILKKNWKLNSFLIAIAPALTSVIGILIGVYVNSNHQHLITLMYDQLFRTGLGAGMNVPAGNEWNPFDPVWFLQSNALILICWLLSVVILIDAFIRDKAFSKENSTLAVWLQFTAFGLLGLTLWHRRFVEYWAPFTVLATAVTLQPYIKKITWSAFKEALQYWQMKLVVLSLLLATGAVLYYNVEHAVSSLKNSDSAYLYQAAGTWLNDNSKEGDIVFNTQWDQFPQMFYWDSKSYYIIGLDPTFMYIQDKDLYWKWRKIADDNPEDWESLKEIHQILVNDFKAKYIFFGKNNNSDLHDKLNSLEATGLFKIRFEDENVAIFSVLPCQTETICYNTSDDTQVLKPKQK